MALQSACVCFEFLPIYCYPMRFGQSLKENQDTYTLARTHTHTPYISLSLYIYTYLYIYTNIYINIYTYIQIYIFGWKGLSVPSRSPFQSSIHVQCKVGLWHQLMPSSESKFSQLSGAQCAALCKTSLKVFCLVCWCLPYWPKNMFFRL